MKGAVLACAVRTLRKWRKEHPDTPLPTLSLGARALLETRIDPKLWYPYHEYLELMQVLCEVMLGGDVEAFADFAAAGAPLVYHGAHRSLIADGDPFSTIREIKALWGSCHDFGRPDVEVGATEVLVRISETLPMSRAEGFIITGWIRGVLQIAGATGIDEEILDEPWDGASQLSIRYRWDFRSDWRL